MAMALIDIGGRTVAYELTGSGGAPPLVCVHGFTGSKEDFGRVVDGLGADRPVVTLDLPGHGESGGYGEAADYSLASHAAVVLACADALGLGDIHLLGHSLGGLVAQRVAATCSQRLDSLVLADTGLGAPPEAACQRLARIATTVRDEGLEAGHAVSSDGRASTAQEQTAEREGRGRSRFLRLDPAGVIGEARALTTASPAGPFLRGIDVPVLVLHGQDEDVWPGAEQRALAATVAGARSVVIADSGHTPQVENPVAWITAVAGFLREADMQRDRRSAARGRLSAEKPRHRFEQGTGS